MMDNHHSGPVSLSPLVDIDRKYIYIYKVSKKCKGKKGKISRAQTMPDTSWVQFPVFKDAGGGL